MKYLLDSNTASDLFDKQASAYSKLQGKLKSLNESDEIFIPILVLFELEYGYENAPEHLKSKIRSKIVKLKSYCPQLPLNEASASEFGKLKKFLKESGKLKQDDLKLLLLPIFLRNPPLEYT